MSMAPKAEGEEETGFLATVAECLEVMVLRGRAPKECRLVTVLSE